MTRGISGMRTSPLSSYPEMISAITAEFSSEHFTLNSPKSSKAEENRSLTSDIARILMDKMGGELSVRNENGLCVTLLIPLS